ncbi:AsmA-like C-terminal region-containing protein [Halomonas sp. Bachu 37]|uniref:YhdP family phospholipid transporter n=1 Tax=Halomonas kashgarensis TaxID=3084920 RepID=UPI003216D44F
MSRMRLGLRWVLTFLAVLLGSLAAVLLLLRLVMSQAEALTPRIEAMLEARIGAPVEIGSLSLSFARNDPLLEIVDFKVQTREGEALLALDKLRLRLDTWDSIAAWSPVFNDARLDGLSLHLYQDDASRWHWPGAAGLPVDFNTDTEVDMARLDRWAGLILRQRLWVENSRLMLHGLEQQVTLTAPDLLMTGDERHTRLEGQLEITHRGSPAQETKSQPLMHMSVDVQPGRRGFSDFSAALQADLQLDNFLVLMEMLRPEQVPQLEHVEGDLRLWGRWEDGALADSRVDMDVPILAIRHQTHRAVLQDIHAQAQWLRTEVGGEAWLQADADSASWARPVGVGEKEGPALPKQWYLSHGAQGWQIRTSEFELASLAAWRDYVPLPESLSRVLSSLAPRGQVTGLSLGRHDDEWTAQAAVKRLEVSPWEQAPGGGPLDAWVEARDERGRVLFNSSGITTLSFPKVFINPMVLEQARGEVQWVYDGPASLVSGKDLRIAWDGAQLQGGFGLVTGKERGHFGLDIAFTDVDALERPLEQWLPLVLFDEGLRDWLLNDVGGYVEEGSLKLSRPLFEGAEAEDTDLELMLSIVDGHLPIAEDWPLLDGVSGRMKLVNQRLEAVVEKAHSHGVLAQNAEVLLEDGLLAVAGELEAETTALKSFLQAAPLDGIEMLQDWQGKGRVEGQLALETRLDAPESLLLEIDTTGRFSELAYRPLGLAISEVKSDLAWRQRGEKGGLSGYAEGRLLGGKVAADIDTLNHGIDFTGRAHAGPLLTWAGLTGNQSQEVATGAFDWQGRLALTPRPRLQLQSSLVGLELAMPAPLTKPRNIAWPWRMDAQLEQGRWESQLANVAHVRSLTIDNALAGRVWLGEALPATGWPQQPGWEIDADVPSVDPVAWYDVAQRFQGGTDPGAEQGGWEGVSNPWQVNLQTHCVSFQGKCLGELSAEGRVESSSIDFNVGGTLVRGLVNYDPQAEHPLDIALSHMNLDLLLAFREKSDARDTTPQPSRHPTLSWTEEIETRLEEPRPMPDWLGAVPDGRFRLADVIVNDQQFGPMTAFWETRDDRFSLAPVGLTLGQTSARGELQWVRQGASSRTFADLTLQGRDIGTTLERLGQPVALRSGSASIASRLEWPGAPWQFDLRRADGALEMDLQDGRFLAFESTPARLIGLLNFEYLLRRLRLGFSDLTGEGMAFNHVRGAADIRDGSLTTRGPVEIEAPVTTFTLDGSANLIRRELALRLGVILPVSQSLPLAALAAGAPVVGGALFIAHTLFGDAIERATRIHYRVRGPWADPQITLEGAE